MQKGRMLATTLAVSIAVGAFGVGAWTAVKDGGPVHHPVLLKNATLYMNQQDKSDRFSTVADASGRALYVVQFSGPVKEAYKTALVRQGVELGDYLPEYAYLVRMAPAKLNGVQKLGFVKGVKPFTASYKLDPALLKVKAGERAAVRIATFGLGTKGPVSTLSTLGIRPDSIGLGVVTAQVDAAKLQSLAASADVVYVEQVRAHELFNDKAGTVMGLPTAWGAGLDGKGQVVAVTDTGLDTGKNDASMHPDFQGQIKSLYALGKPGDASDTLAHGTHVAGSVLGNGSASNGLFKGTAPGARLVFQSVEDTKGSLSGIPEDLTKLFSQAYQDGARIHTNSWGVPASSGGAVYDSQSAAVDRFMWEYPEYAILFAAGNDGDHDRDGQTNYSTVSTPGTSKNAITVGASQNDRPDKKMGTNINDIASFSSRGPTTDGRVKPDIVAPGTWIVSARSSKSTDKHFWAPHESNNKYGYMGGTSMSTPLTAGATAVVRQFYMEKLGVTPRASLLKATLINGAAAMGQNLAQKDTGWGRVDIKNSLYGSPFKFVNEEKALQTGEAQTYSYEVKAGKPLKLTLVWTDFPATPAAEKALVNDLDLVVKGPDGSELLGNHMLGAGIDRKNNVENVQIATPKAGTYTVTVKAHNVPQGPQRFALVASGEVAGGTQQPTPPPQEPDPKPPVEDKEAPVITISSPTAGAQLSGTVQITADAKDNVGISKVVFSVAGEAIGTATAAPYTVTWETNRYTNGTYTLQAQAYDAVGNVGAAKAVNVVVTNGTAAGLQELQFTDRTGTWGTAKRYYVDVKAGGSVSAVLALQGWANVNMVALDSSGRQVSTGTNGLSFTAATGGTYAIVVNSLGGWADYALKVTYPAANDTAVMKKSGSLTAIGQRYHVYPITIGKAGSVNAFVTFSDPRADLDLYLVDGWGRLLTQATSPNLNPETFSAYLSPGTYYLYVVADSGQAGYQLSVVHPK
jgi:serine protease AprX